MDTGSDSRNVAAVFEDFVVVIVACLGTAGRRGTTKRHQAYHLVEDCDFNFNKVLAELEESVAVVACVRTASEHGTTTGSRNQAYHLVEGFVFNLYDVLDLNAFEPWMCKAR